MSLITYPTQLVPSSCIFTLATSQRVNASPFGGSEQAVDLLNDRWTCSLSQDVVEFTTAPYIEAFIGAMRGQTNWAPIYHFARPAPRGTARGTILVNGAVAQGASSIAVDGISPSTGTLLAGDMLGVGGMLFMVASDVTAVAGAATVQITSRVRTAIVDNAAVTWDKPTTLFRLLSTSGVQYSGAAVESMTFDFGEKL